MVLGSMRSPALMGVYVGGLQARLVTESDLRRRALGEVPDILHTVAVVQLDRPGLLSWEVE